MNFRSFGGRAQDLELSADTFGSLTHPRKAPMSLSARGQELRIHAATIVANQEPQLARGILDFHYNLSGAAMAASISKGFASNGINLIMHNPPQLPWHPFHDDATFAFA